MSIRVSFRSQGAVLACVMGLLGCDQPAAPNASPREVIKVLGWHQPDELRGDPAGRIRAAGSTNAYVVVHFQIPASLIAWRAEPNGWAYDLAPEDFHLHRSDSATVLNAEGLRWEDGDQPFSESAEPSISGVQRTRSFAQKPQSCEETVIFIYNYAMAGSSRFSISYRDSGRAALTPETENPGL